MKPSMRVTQENIEENIMTLMVAV